MPGNRVLRSEKDFAGFDTKKPNIYAVAGPYKKRNLLKAKRRIGGKRKRRTGPINRSLRRNFYLPPCTTAVQKRRRNVGARQYPRTDLDHSSKTAKPGYFSADNKSC